MGYTHYWKHNKQEDGKFEEAVMHCNKILAVKESMLADAFGDNELETSPEQLRFNGRGEDSHETFAVRNENNDFDFCKTAYKPYDVVVTACLTVLSNTLDNFKVSSDGDESDFEAGVSLAEEVTGLKLKNPLERVEDE